MMGMKKNVFAVTKTGLLQAAILLVGFGCVTYTIEVYNLQTEVSDLRGELSEVGDLKRAKIEQEVNAALLLSRALSVAIELEPDTIDQTRYSKIAAKMIEDNSSVLNVAAAPDLIVKFVYPVEENAAVIGLNYRENTAQYAAAQQTMDLGQPVLAGPLNLVQGGEGFILRNVIHTPEGQGNAERELGIVSVVLDKSKFLASLHSQADETIQNVAIRKVSTEAGGKTAYVPISGDQGLFEGDPVIMDINVPSGKWQLALQPLNGWPVVSEYFLRNMLAFVLVLGAVLALFTILNRTRSHKEVAEVRLRTALEACEQGFALYDAEDRLALCNTRFMQDNNLSPTEVKQRPSFEEILRAGISEGRYHTGEFQDENWIKKRLETHNQLASVQHLKLPDQRWLKVTNKKLPDGGVISFAVDISEIIKAKEIAESSEKAKMRFMDAVSHELKTPLSILLGYTAFLENPEHLKSVAALKKQAGNKETFQTNLEHVDAVTSEVKGHAGRIKTAGLQLQTLIEKVLEFTSNKAETPVVQEKTIRAGQVIGPIAERFRTEASQKGLEFSVIIEETTLQADPLHVDRVLSRMIENAIQTTETGSIRISVKPSGDFVNIMVRDTGSGFHGDIDGPQDDAQSFQSDLVDFIKADGLGAASEEKPDGKVSVDFDRGHGKLVTFTLPILHDPRQAAAKDVKAAE